MNNPTQTALIKALEDCIDSLEYVNHLDNPVPGYGVRRERIQSALRAISLVKLKENRQ